jgi:thiol:disulfide interchange protein DsbC
MNVNTLRLLAVTALAALPMAAAVADEAAIRKSLSQRLPNFPSPDEVTVTSIPGLWEVRLGTDLLYTDAQGTYLIEGGTLIDTRSKRNLTKERVDKLTAVRFDELPIKDAFVIKQGTGARKIAVFADPNCGYCKRLERDLVALKDVTIYNFLFPVLGPDSDVKSRAIWCTKDAGAAWRSWMLDGVTPPRAAESCDTKTIDRNVAFGRQYRINGTPAIVFEDGVRVPGALGLAAIEKRLAEVAAAGGKPKS